MSSSFGNGFVYLGIEGARDGGDLFDATCSYFCVVSLDSPCGVSFYEATTPAPGPTPNWAELDDPFLVPLTQSEVTEVSVVVMLEADPESGEDEDLEIGEVKLTLDRRNLTYASSWHSSGDGIDLLVTLKPHHVSQSLLDAAGSQASDAPNHRPAPPPALNTTTTTANSNSTKTNTNAETDTLTTNTPPPPAPVIRPAAPAPHASSTSTSTSTPAVPSGSRDTQLHQAIESNDLDQVRRCLQLGADPNSERELPHDEEGYAALHRACGYGQCALCVESLLRAGAQVSLLSGPHLWTPLHVAAAAGCREAVAVLLDWGADVDAASGMDATTALMEAVRAGEAATCQLLLSCHADVARSDSCGMTALHWAARLGDPEILHLLVEGGADVNVRVKSGGEDVTAPGAAPLHFAARKGHLQVLKLLMSAGGNPTEQDCHGRTPLHEAAFHGHVECVTYLYKDKKVRHSIDIPALSQDDYGASALQWAVVGGQEEVVRRILRLIEANNPGGRDDSLNMHRDVNMAYCVAHCSQRDAMKSHIAASQRRTAPA